jgi:hypothetical protein
MTGQQELGCIIALHCALPYSDASWRRLCYSMGNSRLVCSLVEKEEAPAAISLLVSVSFKSQSSPCNATPALRWIITWTEDHAKRINTTWKAIYNVLISTERQKKIHSWFMFHNSLKIPKARRKIKDSCGIPKVKEKEKEKKHVEARMSSRTMRREKKKEDLAGRQQTQSPDIIYCRQREDASSYRSSSYLCTFTTCCLHSSPSLLNRE